MSEEVKVDTVPVPVEPPVVVEEPKPDVPETPPKRKRGRPRKHPLPE